MSVSSTTPHTFDDRTQAGASPDVTNAGVLSLPCSLWWGMDQGCIDAMNKIQMQYAASVAEAAAAAYRDIITELEKASKPKPA